MTEAERQARFEKALAIDGPTHSPADIAALIKSGAAQWWSNGDGIIVTEILEFPLMKVCNYFLVAGELAAVFALQPAIDEWALAQGCTHATACGRRGWQRAAAAYGWRLRGYRYVKPLEAGP